MKVKELKEFLNSLPPEMDEAELICQKDSEGNGYSPLAGADSEAVYEPETTWSGDIYDLSWTADEACMTKKEWNEIKKRPKCVVLYPIN
jgi:hypothetical protein